MVLANGVAVDLGTLGHAWVGSLIGQGGQGFVHVVRLPSGRELALKWFRPESASREQFEGIRALVESGSPHHRFLWPLSLAHVPGVPGFGYVMELRDRRFLELSHLLANRDKDGRPLDVTFAATLRMCRQLAFSFLRLHARGLCYRDISFGNVFFEQVSGDVLICDNDNVGIDNGTSRVLGTPYFMAPEVVSDTTYATLPNTDTDRHSLAVLLFYVLFMGHPLEGALTDQGLRDPAWLQEHFGLSGLFCMHPDDPSNRPPLIVQQYWSLYPAFVRELFEQAFVAGLTDPSRRVTEGQWIKAMDRLRDGMVRCSCGATEFWDPAARPRFCRQCGSPVDPAYVVEVGRRQVAVSSVAELRADHFGVSTDDDQQIATVVPHPSDPDRWGITNTSGRGWSAKYPGGSDVPVPPGSTVELNDGLHAHTGSGIFVVRRRA